MRFFYSLFFILLLPILFLRLIYKQKKSSAYQTYSQQGRWKERLGWLPALKFEVPPIWIHTVSVGEFIAALPLIHHFLKHYPHIPILITTTTLTGSERVKSTFSGDVQHVYLPWDIPFAVKRFYSCVKPRMGLIMETELWPNLIHYGHCHQIPLLLLNARMSEKSAKGYQKVSDLTANMLNGLEAICVQNDEDAERLIMLGAKEQVVHISGSIKFDLQIDVSFKSLSQRVTSQLHWDSEKVMIAASTHASEDEIILEVYGRLRQEFSQLKLIVVPRHPERFQQVYELCISSGYSTLKRSEISSSQQENVDILVGDSMGEMMLYYYLSDVVVMGGTFVPNGGHNILEPAALGLPIFYGPSMFNFRTINALFLRHQAAVQVNDKSALYNVLLEYFKNSQSLEKMGNNALEIIQKNMGAKDRMLQVIGATGRLQ